MLNGQSRFAGRTVAQIARNWIAAGDPAAVQSPGVEVVD
jgi:hypothetical protein